MRHVAPASQRGSVVSSGPEQQVRELSNEQAGQDVRTARSGSPHGVHATASDVQRLQPEPVVDDAGAMARPRPKRHVGEITGLVKKGGPFGYGFIAQACSSATNFGLVVIAGRVLGPSGVGTMFVGFAAYLVLLGFERSLLTVPLISQTSAQDPADQLMRARFAVTLAIVALIPITGLLVGIGLFLPERFGLGLVLFSPWIVVALLQDLGRSIVFRDRYGRSTALSDAIWLATMAAVAPVAFATGSAWAVVGSWGAGAAAAAAVALIHVRWTPTKLSHAIAWWRSEAWRFARWLGMESTVYSVATYTGVLALIAILGAGAFGGLRAVESLFAPLTLLGPALALPGLPLISRVLAGSSRKALATSAGLGALVTLLTGAYVIVLLAVPDLLSFIFGAEFVEFRSIIVPIAVGQVLAAPLFGLTLFLQAQQRGRILFALGTLNAFAALGFAVTLGSLFGLEGAAWASALTSILAALFLTVALLRERSSWS